MGANHQQSNESSLLSFVRNEFPKFEVVYPQTSTDCSYKVIEYELAPATAEAFYNFALLNKFGFRQ